MHYEWSSSVKVTTKLAVLVTTTTTTTTHSDVVCRREVNEVDVAEVKDDGQVGDSFVR